MKQSRRDFLLTGAKAGAAMSALGAPALTRPWTADRPGGSAEAIHPLRILVLGGTAFLGPHQIAYALGRGHSVTTFTRGRRQPCVHARLFAEVEQLVGYRATDLGALRGRSWDVVIDNSGRSAEWTRDSAQLLRDSVDLYVYTSSTGVYYPYLGTDIGEDTPPVVDVPEGVDEDASAEYAYGVMKARSEIEARRLFGDGRTIVVRPTYMMGPGDGTDRFTYWPARLAVGGDVVVPGRADDPVQYVDVRDVAAWMIRLAENRVAGTFNAVGPTSPTGMHAFVYGAYAAFASPASFVMVDDHAFLEAQRIGASVPWILPRGNNAGSARVSNARAVANGLTLSPLARSVWDIHEWWHSDAVEEERRERLLRGPRSLMAREPEVIAAWRARTR
jgi:2'-hydroxyisoflavone reductase